MSVIWAGVLTDESTKAGVQSFPICQKMMDYTTWYIWLGSEFIFCQIFIGLVLHTEIMQYGPANCG